MKQLKSPDIGAAVEALRAGSIVAYPTETCYGLAVDVSNSAAVAKLFALKQRPADMPVSVLFASVVQAKEYVEWNERAEKLAEDNLPGPLTIILPSKTDTPTPLHVTATLKAQSSKLKTIGIRVSTHPIAQALVTAFGKPISTTSANIHGEPNTYSTEELVSQLQPDLVLDSGELHKNEPSKVVDLSDDKAKILR